MSLQPKRAPRKSPPDDRNSARRRIAYGIAWLLHETVRLLFLFAALIGLAALYVWVVGLSGPPAEFLLDQLGLKPFVVTAERIVLTSGGGIEARGVFLYADDRLAEPMARAQTIVVAPHWRDWLKGSNLFSRITIGLNGGRVLLPPSVADPTAERVTIDDILLNLRVDGRRLDVERASARCGVLAFSVEGEWEIKEGLRRTAQEILNAFSNWLARAASDPRLPAFAKLPRRLGLTSGVTVRARVSGSADSPLVTLSATGGPLRWQEIAFDRFEGTASWFGDQYAVERFTLEGPGDLRVVISTPPAPLNRMPDELEARFSFSRFAWRGLSFSDGAGMIRLVDRSIRAEGVYARLGENGDRGEIALEAQIDPVSGILEGEIDLQAYPRDFESVLTSNQVKIARRFLFAGSPPRYTGVFRYTGGEHPALFLEGVLTAEQFSYREVPIDRTAAGILYSNHVLTLSPWLFEQEGNETRGSLALPTDKGPAVADLASTMHPYAIAGLIGPKFARRLAEWRFDGPVFIKAVGKADIHAGERETDLIVEVRARQVGRGALIADELAFTLHAGPDTYVATGIVGQAYGGRLSANVRVEPASDGLEQRFIFSLTLADASFPQLVARFAPVGGDTGAGGYVQLTLSATGLMSDVLGPVTRGRGRLKIEDAPLLRTRLFGPLSEFLSSVVPGLGYITQNDLDTAFIIEDGAVYSEDILLSGDIISIRMSGRIDFEGDVNMKAEVQLLRQGTMATILRLMTLPVTKLFEFRVTGTVQEPRWRPVKLPKELFLIFD